MTVATTGIDDLADILELLHDLTTAQFKRLGLQLGLLISTLNSLDSENYGMEVIEAWLNKRDNVIQRRGPPTWNSLIGALLAHSVSLKVQAQRIEAWLEQSKLLSRHWCAWFK